jgi:hypothetical protein
LNQIHDAVEQLFLDLEKIVPVGGKHVGKNLYIQGRSTEAYKSDTHGSQVDIVVATKQGANASAERAQLDCGCFVVQSNHRVKQEPVPH